MINLQEKWILGKIAMRVFEHKGNGQVRGLNNIPADFLKRKSSSYQHETGRPQGLSRHSLY